MIQFQENKRTDSRMEDGQTLFHRILSAAAGGLASTTVVDWHLKVKDIQYNVGLTKNFSITVSLQKSMSIPSMCH